MRHTSRELRKPGPSITPEDGVTGYAGDHTQGPACAIAAGAATIYRNYFAPVEGGIGQTRERQINALAAVGEALSAKLGRTVPEPVADAQRLRVVHDKGFGWNHPAACGQ